MKRAKNFFTKDNLLSFFKPTKKNIAVWAAIIIILIIAVSCSSAKKKASSSVFARETDIVTRGDVDVTITGSASVEPYERFEIIPKVSGDIVYCPFDVGDSVEKGDLLYGFDTSSSDLTVERQRLSLEQSENSYKNALEERDKLYIKAKNNGTISGFSLKTGQEVKNGTKIADIADTDNLEVVLPFTAAQISSIHAGDSASITSSKHMSSVSGVVTHISSSSYAGSDGSSLYNVTIKFNNPGVLSSGMSVGGAVGTNVSPGSGIIENSASSSLFAETDGTVSKIYYSNGDYVTKGAVIAVLTSDSVDDRITDSTLSYKSASLSMRQTEKDLEDYNITSPISGTVITKKSKAGDTIDKTTSQTVMMVVADISKLKFELSIDELDISKVTEGQTVSVTCDALPDETFLGYITTISVEGTAQNGVTTYSAEVVIDEPGNLRPSMNIDASVITDSAKNVLLIPTEDIKTIGKKTYVFVKGEKDEAKSSVSDKNTMPDKNSNPKEKSFDKVPQAPDGYIAVEIETGVANEDFTEVTKGLTEGQEIYRQSTVSASNG
nr:efflux RND transporter periplasmic adaptor subunit [Bacillota bacterium]